MAASIMKKGWVQAVLVGCDRIAANGDTANKIGTLGLAILAAHFGVPFYVHAPRSTIDMNCATGLEIEIEERAAEEITTKWYEKPMAPEGVKAFNPAFDVTDAELITAIVTEKGVVRAPYKDSLRAIMQ
jgi:methylthioribose-1-phosphate isomerase